MPYSAYPLSDAQVASFVTDGFVRIDNAFPAQLAEAPLLQRLLPRSGEERKKTPRGTGQCEREDSLLGADASFSEDAAHFASRPLRSGCAGFGISPGGKSSRPARYPPGPAAPARGERQAAPLRCTILVQCQPMPRTPTTC